ncbi:MAG: hypothetical protein ACLTTO_09860 [Lachnospiraceae bacterium]
MRYFIKRDPGAGALNRHYTGTVFGGSRVDRYFISQTATRILEAQTGNTLVNYISLRLLSGKAVMSSPKSYARVCQQKKLLLSCHFSAETACRKADPAAAERRAQARIRKRQE